MFTGRCEVADAVTVAPEIGGERKNMNKIKIRDQNPFGAFWIILFMTAHFFSGR
jgi:hypothetical protein